MSFVPEKVDEFISIFDSVKTKIAEFDGCSELSLMRDAANSNVLYTISYWNSEDHLNKYRFSELFKDTWTDVRALFTDKAEAWSLLTQEKVK